jgi:hypothetical protein
MREQFNLMAFDKSAVDKRRLTDGAKIKNLLKTALTVSQSLR